MLPEVAQLEYKSQETEVADLGKTFQYDFAQGEFVLSDGKLIKIEDLEALQIWVEKLLRTEKHRFKVYERVDRQEYGATIEDLIGTVLPKSFVDSELKREISDAVTKHPRITSVSNLTIQQDGAVAKISFRLNLSDGQAVTQEVTF